MDSFRREESAQVFQRYPDVISERQCSYNVPKRAFSCVATSVGQFLHHDTVHTIHHSLHSIVHVRSQGDPCGEEDANPSEFDWIR